MRIKTGLLSVGLLVTGTAAVALGASSLEMGYDRYHEPCANNTDVGKTACEIGSSALAIGGDVLHAATYPFSNKDGATKLVDLQESPTGGWLAITSLGALTCAASAVRLGIGLKNQ